MLYGSAIVFDNTSLILYGCDVHISQCMIWRTNQSLGIGHQGDVNRASTSTHYTVVKASVGSQLKLIPNATACSLSVGGS